MPSRRADASQGGAAPVTGSSARPRMYNLTAHALSSGSLLPRTNDANTAGVNAADAPYLTNVENHWGRVTLTAPDNMRRRQAKEKKQKARQKKAQTALTAASALAGVSTAPAPAPTPVVVSTSRPTSASATSLHDSEHMSSSTGLLAPPPAIRRVHSGTQVVTLASTSAPEPVRRTHRRRASNTRDDVMLQDGPRSTAPPISSLHRQNIWNDITEPEMEDMPPPFPEGAPRPPSPPPHEPPSDSNVHVTRLPVQIPDSPPPAFRSDPESEADTDAVASTSHVLRRRSQRRSSASSRRTAASHSPSASESSQSEGESSPIAQERQAWEADIQNGLSFEIRMLREQQRRAARERALLRPASDVDLEQQEPEEPPIQVVPATHPDVLGTAQRRRLSGIPDTDSDQQLSSVTAEAAPVEAGPVQPPSLAIDVQQHKTAPAPLPPVAAVVAPAFAAPASSAAPLITTSAPTPTRQTLQNETRLGLPPQPKKIAHRKTNSDSRSTQHGSTARLAPSQRPVSAAPRLRVRSASGTVRQYGNDKDVSRRPEDTLFVISAPPAVASERATDQSSFFPTTTLPGSLPVQTSAPITSTSVSESESDGEGAESDSSIEQWLAESAAFDALRRKEEDAAVRLRTLREVQVADSDQESENLMPGSFKVDAAGAPRDNWPDPASLALMDKARPKAPPPLVLGRSRGGGAAYSDSSSESTDTDDALDQYSSSEHDTQAYQEASTVLKTKPTASNGVSTSKALVKSRNSTLSEPDLTGVHTQPPLPPRPIATSPSAMPNKQITSTSLEHRIRPSAGVVRTLSSTARGKLPERTTSATEAATVTKDQALQDKRAGEFEEDTTSSRDVSDSEESARLPPPRRTSSSSSTLQRPQSSVSRTSLPMLEPTRSNSSGVSRASLDPLLQPLSYGRTRSDLGGRLKGLFGQGLLPAASGSDTVTDAPPSSASEPSRAPSIRSERPKMIEEQQGRVEFRQPAPVPLVKVRMNQASIHSSAVSIAPSRTESLTKRSAPEQQARDEALSQIAKLSSASSAQRDSLAALERLLAKTSRPASMGLPTTSALRSSVQGPRPLPTEPAPVEVAVADHFELLTPVPIANASRLSRQGAIVRGRPPNENGLLAPVTFAAAGSTRPVSFVNPRSSAAPLPRGRLPAITDATRHFPPTAPAPAPVQIPSWLVNIPDDDQEKLPTPIEPRRLSTADTRPVSPSKNPSGKVSQMISRFESPSSQPAATPIRKQSSSTSLARQTSEAEGAAVESASLPVEPLRRRAPPPPPMIYAQPADIQSRPNAEQLSIDGRDDATTSRAGVSAPSPNVDRVEAIASERTGFTQVPSSPRTLALENLTRRESIATPPRLPSKSPLITPEQIFAGGSRTGLSASIAAAQAASSARRASRAARTASITSSEAVQSPTSGLVGLFGPVAPEPPTHGLASPGSSGNRPLPTTWEGEPSSSASGSGRGLMASAVLSPTKRAAPPPPLPRRPQGRDWAAQADKPSAPQPVTSQPPAPEPSTPSTSYLAVNEETDNAGGSSADEVDASPPHETSRVPRREASLGITDFDLLVAQLEREGAHYEQLSAIGEFLGPAKATSATAEQMASLSVGKVECDSRRVTKEGKVKQKLSCVGVRVDKCTICQTQFKEHQMAAILPCLHIFHEDCATQLFRRVNTCPSCRRLAFDF